jgi:hypothetical protein
MKKVADNQASLEPIVNKVADNQASLEPIVNKAYYVLLPYSSALTLVKVVDKTEKTVHIIMGRLHNAEFRRTSFIEPTVYRLEDIKFVEEVGCIVI